MDKERIIKVLNEWERRYVENPTKFESDFRTVIQYLDEIGKGLEPSYGEDCFAYMLKLDKELT